MDCAPLNLAHFHERRADKLIKRHRYEEAFKAIETSLLYLDDAYKNVKIPKALEVLNTQKWDYERKLKQIQMRKIQYERMKSKEIVPSVQIEVAPNNSNNLKTDIVNAQSIARSIDKTIKEFNDKYGSTLMENIQRMETQTVKENNDGNKMTQEQIAKLSIDNTKEMLAENLETNLRRLSLMDNHLLSTDDDLPSLAPLELPSFDYSAFDVASTSGLVENFQK
ncbi:nuclear receptor-binding factor 2 [Lucilia sericata]|uniref:nuclear receptor-binding factor 2 n=1 Tax=Lucilia sericata TaxID=13632 RepID=UPI0018A7EB82|nr:nuclear receptor-binding factor 2 [Lucilia sericata]